MSKAARAVEIYTEELALGGESLRKRCIARFKSELSMKDAGAGTYFQNTKKKMEAGGTGGQLTLSVKPPVKSTVDSAPNSEDTPMWSRYVTDQNDIVEVVECYATQAEALAALAEKGGYATTNPEVIKVGDCYK